MAEYPAAVLAPNGRDILCGYRTCGLTIGLVRQWAGGPTATLAVGYRQTLAGMWERRPSGAGRPAVPRPQQDEVVRCCHCAQLLRWDRTVLLTPEGPP